MNDLPAVWNAITPYTVVTTAAVALVFAVFLWHVFPRVTGVLLITIWIGGFAFLTAGGAGRYVEGSATWQAYPGIAALWTWYLVVTCTAVVVWRRVRRRLGDG